MAWECKNELMNSKWFFIFWNRWMDGWGGCVSVSAWSVSACLCMSASEIKLIKYYNRFAFVMAPKHSTGIVWNRPKVGARLLFSKPTQNQIKKINIYIDIYLYLFIFFVSLIRFSFIVVCSGLDKGNSTLSYQFY